jgi:hypothetical protein
LPARGAASAKRTSFDWPGSRSIDLLASPRSVSPSTAISTSTFALPSPFEVTTTPASIASPARRKRGSAGRAISGRLVVTRDSPYPKRSSSAAVTAMIRYVVSESGSLKLARTFPSASVISAGW